MSDRMRVMLVDDDVDTQKIVQLIMRHYRLDLEVFGDGESALDRLEKKPDPDIMIIDIVLPGIDGYQTLGHGRDLAPGCRMIATSAYYSQTTANEVESWGFNGFLPKPLHPATLVDDLRRFMLH